MDVPIREPEDHFIRFGPEVVEEIRREHNLDKKEDREEAIAIIEKWLKSQDHLVKKDFSKDYIERCIVTSNGSIERAKKQIDKLATFKTLIPKYFQVVNILDSDVTPILDTGYLTLLPNLTKEYHRVSVLKLKSTIDVKSSDFVQLFKVIIVTAEYLKLHDYCRGYMLVCDLLEANPADALSKLNLVELQQFLPILTEGYGSKIKGIIFLTSSKFIDGFIKLIKPFFSDKIASRLHVAPTLEALRELLSEDVLPEEYGGKAPSLAVLHEKLVKQLSSEKHQAVMKEMNRARTDETKRQRDKFNDQYMGMAGTFRTLSLD
uniref:SFRICE_012374 n=1 Tax=Spodoptera frugiperda TaxID=7108 RepID=A0A2H1VYX3_SPOFR